MGVRIEIDAIRDEANDRTIYETFRRTIQGGAWNAGRVCSTPYAFRCDKSISLANDLGCSSSNSFTAYVIQQLRTAAKANEW